MCPTITDWTPVIIVPMCWCIGLGSISILRLIRLLLHLHEKLKLVIQIWTELCSGPICRWILNHQIGIVSYVIGSRS